MFKRLPLFVLFFTLVSFLTIRASHNRAGEITYVRIAPFYTVQAGITVQVYTYSITVIIYTDDAILSGGNGIADRCKDTIYFGDGDIGIAPRLNNPLNICGCGSMNNTAIGCGSLIVSDADYKVKKNIYGIVHTYPGPGDYIISTLDPNRNNGVRNMRNSFDEPFHIESRLIINAFTGANSSPIFDFAPIDKACIGVCFEHNPGAFDPDGDSLSYEISTPRGQKGQTVVGYFDPETQAGGSFGIDPVTGLLRWCNPIYQAEYNIAFKVIEWRKNTSRKYEIIGYVLRDMQVIVRTCDNSPPSITVPSACVEAGKTVTANLIVKDLNNGSFVTVKGGGGAFEANSPIATFNPQSGNTYTSTGSSFAVFFSWQTNCNHIRNQHYYTTFKVEDNGTPKFPIKLASFSTFDIRVVPPSVKNVTAVPSGSDMKVSWSPSVCSPTENPLVGYKIYRKQDCNPYIPEPCQVGVPASSGFTLIGNVTASVNLFTDNNNGEGLIVGQDYSYMVVAVYKDGTETFGSSQICAKLKRNVPVLLNVDVDSTSATGAILLKWIHPLTGTANFDTTIFTGPYQLNLKHRSGSSGTYTTIATFTSNLVALLDTQYVHKDFNTEVGTEEYLVEFISGTTTIGSSQKAPSVFLTTKGSDRRINLKWTANTPWKNSSYKIMRRDSSSNAFVLAGTTSQMSFIDSSNVINGSSYCYYVISQGKYSDPSIYSPLINKSQISCAKAVDTIPPTTPTISIDADCPYGIVLVSWGDISQIYRSDDVAKYTLYYKSFVNSEYKKIAEILRNEPLVFKQDDPNLFSGCYAVKATDIHENVGPLSPDFCIDNCPIFELPNVFSPNKDEVNDFFQAIRVRQIKEIDLSVVDRWGHLVYTTKDPYFKWDGISNVTKVPVSEGTFFYVCDVYEPRLKGIVKRTLKGTVQVVR
ncbi:gliding motility-associated C-terminal domain-containing protein [Aurantibacillus circumpalustris]|uniref:T9SS type B sorting domain-containing protein n=1 Tax=Aurantibacillus circumpalustris TaxID=3036359 RepID=UPI00295BF471|nr:gliding motility-associated C-terminal domain-containing protein [Aurantibacillus circumpalustris]